MVVRADTLIGLSSSVLTSPTALREVAKMNKLPDANRILPGQRLRIPARLLRGDAVSATLVSENGEVQAGDVPAAVGAKVNEGQSMRTGSNGPAVVALADGSRARLPPSSLAQVAASRNYGGRLPANAAATAEAVAAANAPSHWFAGTLRVLRGSVEVFATQVLRAKPLEVVTPSAVVGVRGTQYRVAFDEGANGRTHAELVEGVARFAMPGASTGADLRAGFGASTDTTGRTGVVAPLLGAPDLSTLPERFAGDAASLRVQVASDPTFDKIVSDQQVAAGTEVRIAGLDDAQWYMRTRRLDTQGIGGIDATRPFVLKARPEPPAYRTPRASAKQAVGAIEFEWLRMSMRRERGCRSPKTPRSRTSWRIGTTSMPQACASTSPIPARISGASPACALAAITARSVTSGASSCDPPPSPHRLRALPTAAGWSSGGAAAPKTGSRSTSRAISSSRRSSRRARTAAATAVAALIRSRTRLTS